MDIIEGNTKKRPMSTQMDMHNLPRGNVDDSLNLDHISPFPRHVRKNSNFRFGKLNSKAGNQIRERGFNKRNDL